MKRRDAREALLALLYEYAVTGEKGNDTLDVMEDTFSGPLSETDKKDIQSLWHVIVQNQDDIDVLISSSLKSWTIDRLAKMDLSILRLAVYEIAYDASIPAKVSINEAVELAKKYSSDQAPKFVNGVLAGCLTKVESQKMA